MNKKLLTGILFIAIGLLFNFISMTYTIGTFSDPGPGLFPFYVSVALMAIGAITVFNSWFTERETIEIKFKNIAIITSSLVCFALVTSHINMIAGIIVLVTIPSLATTSSLSRIIKINIGLIAVAFAFKYLLGLNLPLL
jgi:hypothetical protein